MKTIITLTAALIMALVGICNPVFASGSGKSEPVKQVQAEEQLKAAAVEIKGIVKKTDTGLSLYDGAKSYVLRGDQLPESLIGKIVIVHGDLMTTQNGNAIVVKKVMIDN